MARCHSRPLLTTIRCPDARSWSASRRRQRTPPKNLSEEMAKAISEFAAGDASMGAAIYPPSTKAGGDG